MFKNAILNRIWEVLPGFVVWEIWKEQNNRIFEDRKRSSKEVWSLIQIHTKEILALKQWGNIDMQANAEEKAILQRWEISAIPNFIGKQGVSNTKESSSEQWDPPPQFRNIS